jgi:hypothetical protein
VRGVLRDNLPWVYHTFKKMAGELQLNPLANATYSGNTFEVELKNIGLQDWEEGQLLLVYDGLNDVD